MANGKIRRQHILNNEPVPEVPRDADGRYIWPKKTTLPLHYHSKGRERPTLDLVKGLKDAILKRKHGQS